MCEFDSGQYDSARRARTSFFSNSCFPKLTAFFLFLLNIGNAFSIILQDCIEMPPIPLHAGFTYVGYFTATIKCPGLNKDIALNTVGDRGVLLCNPHAEFHYDFYGVGRPQCHERKMPQTIQLSARLVYAIRSCRRSALIQTEYAIRRLIERQFLSLPELCGQRPRSCNSRVRYSCGQASLTRSETYGHQLDAEVHVAAVYKSSKSLDFYRNVTQSIRRRAGCGEDGQLQAANFHLWHVNNARLADMRVHSWSSECGDHKNTVGTNLERDGVLTCRGCSRKYYLRDKECMPCPYNQYSAPFESGCHACPEQKHWENHELMADLCFSRP